MGKSKQKQHSYGLLTSSWLVWTWWYELRLSSHVIGHIHQTVFGQYMKYAGWATCRKNGQCRWAERKCSIQRKALLAKAPITEKCGDNEKECQQDPSFVKLFLTKVCPKLILCFKTMIYGVNPCYSEYTHWISLPCGINLKQHKPKDFFVSWSHNLTAKNGGVYQ